MRALGLGALFASMVSASGCAGGAARPPDPSRAPPVPVVSARPALPGPAGLDALPLASFQNEEPVVAFARRADTALFVFTHADHLWARPVRDGATEPDEAVDLGPVGTLGVEPTLVPFRDGYALLVDERNEQNHHLRVFKLGPDGVPLTASLTLPPIAEPVGWAGLVLLDQGALALYSVEVEGRSSVSATPLDKGLARALGPAARLAEGVGAWHATSTGHALFVGAVRAPSEGDPRHGHVEILRVEPSGKIAARLQLTDRASAEIDLQLAAISGGVVAAWTDASGTDPAVKLAVVDRDGKLAVAPRYVAAPIGDQALIGLTADPMGRSQRATIAWENIGQVHEGSRVVRLATVGSDGAVSQAQTMLAVESTSSPDLVADGEGVAALTIARVAAVDGSEGGLWPSFVRFAPDLSIRASEPIRFAGGPAPEGVADSVWGLSCAGGRCSALTAHREATTLIHAVDLPVRDSVWKAPAWRTNDELPPSITSMRIVTEGERLAATRAVRLPAQESRSLVAWLSYHLEGTTPIETPPRGEPPYAATLALQTVDDDGVAGTPIVVSKRALSSGGLATTVLPGRERSELVLAWVASDKGAPQVFVTKLDPDGKKLAQKKVTLVERKSKKGAPANDDAQSAAVSGVAIAHAPLAPDARRPDAPVGEGFVVAWVDRRDGNGELYAARVNRDLEKTVIDKRITQAPGDAADPSIVVRGAEAFIAFSDARDGKPSDIYIAHLDIATLREIDDDGRVYSSRGTSRSPKLHAVGGSLLLAWIEEPPVGDKSPAVLKLGLVDDLGRLIGAPRTLIAPEGASITSFAMSCASSTLESCRGVLSYTSGAAPSIGGFTLGADASPTAVRRLGALVSAPFADPSPSFADPAGTSLFFVDEAGPDRGRLRRLGLGW
jgi:hypothetical protein